MSAAMALQCCTKHTAAPSTAHVRSFTPRRVQQQLRQQRSNGSSSGGRGARLIVAAASTAEVGKLISKVEVPAFIPRQDIMDQLLRWAFIEVQENGVANVGMPCKVTKFLREGCLWGFTVSFLKDGVSAAEVRVAFDFDTVEKHDWVGRGADGFPVLEGNVENVDGKNFEIRKVCDKSLSDATRNSIREFCTMLVAAINKYYAFGSCFVDDST